MTTKKLISKHSEVRNSLLYRLEQRAQTPVRIEVTTGKHSGLVGSMHVVPTTAELPLKVFRGTAKLVTPEAKKRFHVAVRDPKNKDRKDFPLAVVVL